MSDPMIEVKIKGKKLEEEIIDYSVVRIIIKPHSIQLIEAFQFNESIEINNKKYKIIEIVKQNFLMYITLMEERE